MQRSFQKFLGWDISCQSFQRACIRSRWLPHSPHTRRVYAAEAAGSSAACKSPCAGSRWPISKPGPLIWDRTVLLPSSRRCFPLPRRPAILPYNVGAAVTLLPSHDSLAQRILEGSEVARLIQAASSSRNCIPLKQLYAPGARVSELCGLKWADAVARRKGEQFTLFGKGRKTRTVLLKPAVWDLLVSLRHDGRSARSIFPTRKGGAPLDPSEMPRIVYPAARRAGLEQKVSPTGCAPRTPAMPSTAKPPSTSSRPPWDTRLSPPPALSARASHRKARASICPIDGSHYFLDAKVCAATTPLKTWPKSLISLPRAAASSSPSVARRGP